MPSNQMEGLTFIDIETVPTVKDWRTESNQFVESFRRRFKLEIGSDHVMGELQMMTDKVWREKAGLYAEWGKVACVSLGRLSGSVFYVKTFCSKDEKEILEAFKFAMHKGEINHLVGHNIKEFDGPFLFRRMLINGFSLPPLFAKLLEHIKPWEMPFTDTMEIWAGGQWKHMAGLDLLCSLMGVPSSKSKISGEDVAGLYYGTYELPWEEEDAMKAIGEYCAGDVVANARLYAKLKGFKGIEDDQIQFIDGLKK